MVYTANWVIIYYRSHPLHEPEKSIDLQGGPPTSYKWSYNPSYPFIRPFIGLITPLITGRGPPCRIHLILVFFLPTLKVNKPPEVVQIDTSSRLEGVWKPRDALKKNGPQYITPPKRVLLVSKSYDLL